MENKGFTLVELIIYGAILGMFLIVMTTLFSSTLDMQAASDASSSLAQDSRYIFSRLSYDISRATSVDIPIQLGQESGSLQLVIDGVAHTYNVNDGFLELTNANGTNVLHSVGTRISNVSFSRYGNTGGKHSIRVSFTLTSATTRTSGPDIRQYQTTIALR